jgi:hypothetical protein
MHFTQCKGRKMFFQKKRKDETLLLFVCFTHFFERYVSENFHSDMS